MTEQNDDAANNNAVDHFSQDTEEFVTFTINGQLFGIPVLMVQDVLSSYRINKIPLAPSEVAGLLNLRGRIVTAIDVRGRLSLPPKASDQPGMSIVVESGNELYSLMVDSVGEVLALSKDDYERNPPTLEPHFREFAEGVYRLDEELLVVLDVTQLLDYGKEEAA